ncbi:Hpt domain-containing protein [Mucilaginibacter myungsuensis]|uniref:Hpt domain-containing protein n=1 Tax=Mucilaginibacter myungsuensis TaxID=649104 RepID=A0A929L4J9_9SPHI|nr:Hpt domain-containing protein [Mucilaginibacter myungsuensis]MBE9664349.1 Hpt domain-containing protein [Mucilaginibacter myungsuensis]MDN3597059.1 Hpt domain-containing protein [Mucilaginibacter myungsuensis]
MSDIKELDLTSLYEITDGSDEFLVEFMDMFLQQAPELLSTIGTAIAAGDWATAGGAAHKIKPNLAMFGMPDCQATIQEVELLCKAGGQDPYEISTKFNQVRSVVSENLVKLTKIRDDVAAKL